MVFFGSGATCPSCGSATSAGDTTRAYVWWDRDEPAHAIREAAAAVRGNMTESQHIHIEGDGHSIQIARDNARQNATVTNTHTWQTDLDALIVNLHALVAHVEPEQAVELEEHVTLLEAAEKRGDISRIRSRVEKTKMLLGELAVGAAGNGVWEAAKVGAGVLIGHLA